MMSSEGSSDEQFINIRNQASLSLAGSLVDAAISFLGLILFANVLGADGLGKFYIVLAITKVALFPIAGIGQSVMKRGSEKGLDSAAFLGGGLIYGTVYAALIALLIGTVLIFIPTLLTYTPAIVMSAFAVFFSRIFYMLLLDTYRSHGKTGFATLTDNAHGIVETGIQVALLLVGFEVVGLLVGTALTTVAVASVLFVVTDIRVSLPTLDTLRSIARFGRWSILASGLGTVYDRLPVLVLGVFLGDAASGYYASAMRLLMIGSYVGGSIAPALMVSVSANAESTGNKSPLEDFRYSTSYAGILAIPIMFGSFAIPNKLMVTVFGPTFTGTGTILMILSFYHLINTYNTVAYSFFDGIGRPDFLTKTRAVALLVRVVLITTLLLQYETMGVIIAVVVSHLIQSIFVFPLLKKEFNQVAFPTRAFHQLSSGALMWIVVTYLPNIYEITSWSSLLVVVGAGALVYLGVVTILDKYLRHTILDLGQDAIQQFVS